MENVFLTSIEQKLLDEGIGAFSVSDKNSLITILAQKEGLTYSEIGEEDLLAHHKKIKTDIMSELSDSTIANGFSSSNGHQYRTNSDDQINLLGKMIQLLLVPTIETVNWKTEDVGYVELTKDEWIAQVFIEGLQHKEQTLYKFNTKKFNIQEAKTDAEVLAETWD